MQKKSRYNNRGIIYRQREGVTTINYEIRYMLMLLTAIINQKPVQTLRRHVRWETILGVADYQDVLNLTYVAMLGIEKEISKDCESEFYQKYRKGLLLQQSYMNAEEVIIWQLERHGIDALFLTDSSIRGLYPRPDMANIRQIEILVDKKHLLQIHRLMREMDYEEQEDRLGNRSMYIRVPGIQVVFCDKVPIENKVFKRYFSEPIKKYLHMENYNFIHILSEEEEYLYRAGRLVELYMNGALKIRDVMDFWQYRKLLSDAFSWKTVKDLLEKAKWGEFVHQIEVLSELWFEEGVRQQYGTALELEEYILSHGQENKYLDRRLLPEEKPRLDFYWRNREEEWAAKKREWLFPPRDYMAQLFPILEKAPFLIIFCWLIRIFRIFYSTVSGRCKKVWFRISVRVLDIEEKMKGLIKGRSHDPKSEEGAEESIRLESPADQEAEESSVREESLTEQKDAESFVEAESIINLEGEESIVYDEDPEEPMSTESILTDYLEDLEDQEDMYLEDQENLMHLTGGEERWGA